MGQEKAEVLLALSLLGPDGISHCVLAGGGGPRGREAVGAKLVFRGRCGGLASTSGATALVGPGLGPMSTRMEVF